jgi:hypothetical protein
MTDGVLLRETLKDADLDKYRYAVNLALFSRIADKACDMHTPQSKILLVVVMLSPLFMQCHRHG